jgi:serine/threonine protein kinase
MNREPQKPSSLNPEIPDKLDSIISKCLCKNPDDRYQNAIELADDLRACQEMMLRASTGPEQITVEPNSRKKTRILKFVLFIVLMIILFELAEEFLMH